MSKMTRKRASFIYAVVNGVCVKMFKSMWTFLRLCPPD